MRDLEEIFWIPSLNVPGTETSRDNSQTQYDASIPILDQKPRTNNDINFYLQILTFTRPTVIRVGIIKIRDFQSLYLVKAFDLALIMVRYFLQFMKYDI